ncbi:hypothetical protein AB0N93_22210 [Streptomyces sp. NPDC091267]|uniref:hypothetical protein n=1 Tax=unclassified Streptomyces TaxID=2593676 RepID=UPI0034158451
MTVSRRALIKGAGIAAAQIPLASIALSSSQAATPRSPSNPRISEWEYVQSESIQSDWSQQFQGMCTDGQYWYAVSNSARTRRIYKLSLDLTHTYASLEAPDSFAHVGSPTIDRTSNRIYIPIENDGAEPTYIWQLSKGLSTLGKLSMWGRTSGSRSPQKWKNSWLGHNPVDGLLYSSAYGYTTDTDPALQVKVINGFSPVTGCLKKQVQLPSLLHHVQSGTFSPNGNLYLATDYSYNGSKRLYSYDFSAVEDGDTAPYWGNIAIPDSGKGDELEVESVQLGHLSWSDSPDSYISAGVLNIEAEDDIYFRHFWVPSPSAL